MKNTKTSAQILEAFRRDSRVRRVFERYHRFRKVLNSDDIFTYLDFFERADSEEATVIVTIGEAYSKVTGRSPRTVGTGNNKNGIAEGEHPFADLIIELFKEEGLDPPSLYAIRKALKKKAR